MKLFTHFQEEKKCMNSNNYNIRKAVEADLDELIELYKACTIRMNKAGLFNWHSSYPDHETISGDIKRGTLYILERDRIHGAMTLNDEQPIEYIEINWEYLTGPFLVVHRLAISPDHQGKGYAVYLMDYAEKLAESSGCQSIRMDVYTINIPGINLYKKLNYRELNEFYFPGFETRFVGLEKRIG